MRQLESKNITWALVGRRRMLRTEDTMTVDGTEIGLDASNEMAVAVDKHMSVIVEELEGTSGVIAPEPARHHDAVAILDFGSQYTQLIARRIRECGVYCEIHPFSLPLDELRRLAPSALIFSGGPSSVYGEGAPRVGPEHLSLGVPVLGVCYGLQLIAHLL